MHAYKSTDTGGKEEYICGIVRVRNGEDILDTLDLVRRIGALWALPFVHFTHEASC